MKSFSRLRYSLIGFFGRIIFWIWFKSTRMTLLGEDEYQKLRNEGKPVIFLVWHGRIFIVPYFFRRRGIMPLISPSKDGEIVARIMSGWGYKILRGSSSHVVVGAWNEMIRELKRGGEVIIVPDGPKGPNRKMKMGGLKLAQQTGAYLVPFSFSASKRKVLSSWDSFVLFKPFTKIVAKYGQPIAVASDLSPKALEMERQRIEQVLIRLDEECDQYFSDKN